MIDVVMPKMGESITEGTILEWKKKVGDSIKKDEALLEISTDKVDSEIPSPASGTIIEITAKINDTVAVGKVIARIGEENETPEIKQDDQPPPEEVSIGSNNGDFEVVEQSQDTDIEEKGKVEPAKLETAETIPSSGRFYSPLVKSIAKRN